jgi:hypothetical protein
MYSKMISLDYQKTIKVLTFVFILDLETKI